MTVKEDIPQDQGSGKRSIGVLADEPRIVGQIADGRIMLAELNKPNLTMQLDGLDEGLVGGGYISVVGNRVSPTPTAESEWARTILPDDFSTITFPIEVSVPTSLLPDIGVVGNPNPTEYVCHFFIEDALSFIDRSLPVTFFVDRNPPYYVKNPFGRTAPPFATYRNLDIAAGEVINDDWANRNPGGLVVVIAATYPDRRDNDTVRFCLNTSSGTTVTMPIRYEGPYTLDGANGVFSIPLTTLRTLPNGGLFQRYKLIDAPLNESLDSVVAGAPLLPIAFLPAPVLFQPEVPAAGPGHNEALSFDSFLDGKVPYVEIPYPTNGDPADQILITVDGIPLGSGSLGPRPGPFRLELTYDILDEATTGATGETIVDISYTLTRGGNPPIPAPTRTIFVNFTFPGPDPDTLPNLDNRNLIAVQVRGRDGAGDLNHLTSADINQPVKFTVPRWAGLPNLTEAATVTYYWNRVLLNTSTLLNSDTETSLTVPYSQISPAGLGSIPATYTLEYPGNPNVMRKTPPTDVLVETFDIDLETHTGPFLQLAGDRWIACESMVPRIPNGDGTYTVPPLRVSVPGGQRDTPPNRDVRMRMNAWIDRFQSAPVPGGISYDATQPMPAGNADNTFEMPFALFKAIQLAAPVATPIVTYYAEIWYEITLGGQTYPSTHVMHPVRARNSSQQYCDQLPPNPTP